jgi:hypothetical protein
MLETELWMDRRTVVNTDESSYRCFNCVLKQEPEADEVYPDIFIGNYKAVNVRTNISGSAIAC